MKFRAGFGADFGADFLARIEYPIYSAGVHQPAGRRGGRGSGGAGDAGLLWYRRGDGADGVQAGGGRVVEPIPDHQWVPGRYTALGDSCSWWSKVLSSTGHSFCIIGPEVELFGALSFRQISGFRMSFKRHAE